MLTGSVTPPGLGTFLAAACAQRWSRSIGYYLGGWQLTLALRP